MDDFLTTAYGILRVPEDASLEEASEAYRRLVKDNTGDWDKIKEIDRAYQVLLAHLSPATPAARPGRRRDGQGAAHLINSLEDLLLPPPGTVNPFAFLGRVFLFLALLVGGVKFICAPVAGDFLGRSFMHLVNLPFHEAGHIFFSFFGDFARVLGGTALQILIPFVCVAAFLKRGDPFGACFALWWAGQSFIDVAPYIYDARAGELMLLGGVTGREAPDFHDWHNMLHRVGLLSYDHAIAYVSKYAGAFLMILSLLWAACVLLRQYRGLDRRK